MNNLYKITSTSWQNNFDSLSASNATSALENGQIIYFPALAYELLENEQFLLAPGLISPHSKNISFNVHTNTIRGIDNNAVDMLPLKNMMSRFQQYAQNLLGQLFPNYIPHLEIGRTSFRPVEIKGRVTSYRKDDTRLHVDAFTATPTQGKRILRVFSNINPNGEARIWRVGEPFAEVAKRFVPQVPKSLPGARKLLHMIGVTKCYRTLYDHYMLQIHNRMKADTAYQCQAVRAELAFPANTTWIVQTDHVSHAALAGQFVLEQTFYLPVHAMADEEQSPLRVLESFVGKNLV